VFRLFKLLFFLSCLGILAYVAFTVPLGERTLVEHIQVILNTRESQELLKGTKEKVDDIVNQATDKVVKGVVKKAPSQITSRGEGEKSEESVVPPSSPMEDLAEGDRKALRGIIGQGQPKAGR
jgi:hypothetical protein